MRADVIPSARRSGSTWAAAASSSLDAPTAATILAFLFVVQSWGTHRVASLFGPVMLLWFVALAAGGLIQLIDRPGIVRGMSPTHAGAFVADRPYTAFIAMGAVVLVITGAEALYADMGHFDKGPIRPAWFAVVFPALTLNYLGQGALILDDPRNTQSPFFPLFPGWARLPMVVLATLPPATSAYPKRARSSGAGPLALAADRP